MTNPFNKEHTNKEFINKEFTEYNNKEYNDKEYNDINTVNCKKSFKFLNIESLNVKYLNIEFMNTDSLNLGVGSLDIKSLIIEIIRNVFLLFVGYEYSPLFRKYYFMWNAFWWIIGILFYESFNKSKNIDIYKTINVIINTLIITLLPIFSIGYFINTNNYCKHRSYYYNIYNYHYGNSDVCIDLWLIIKIVLFFICQDLLFYFIHRILHTPFFYKFHKIHHQIRIVSPFYSQYSSFIETIFNSFTIIIPAILFNINLDVMMILAPLIIISNISSHSYPSKHHGIHHQLLTVNYAEIFIYDWIFGTLKY